MQIHSKVPLQGAELEEYLEKERAKKEREAAKKAAEERRKMILEADEDESEDDDDSDSDSDDENEVERALNGDVDMDQDQKPKERKRRGGKRKDMDDGGWGEGGLDDDEDTKHMLSYDIFLKGNVSKTTTFFKSTEGHTQRFRMFPYIEKRRKIDEYGEMLDIALWLRKGKALEEDAQDDDLKEMKRQQEEEEKVRASIL